MDIIYIIQNRNKSTSSAGLFILLVKCIIVSVIGALMFVMILAFPPNDSYSSQETIMGLIASSGLTGYGIYMFVRLRDEIRKAINGLRRDEPAPILYKDIK